MGYASIVQFWRKKYNLQKGRLRRPGKVNCHRSKTYWSLYINCERRYFVDLYGVPGLFERDNVLVILPNIFVFDVIRTTSKMFYLFHLLSNHIKFKTFKANSFPFERFKRCHGFFLHKYSPQNYRSEKTRKYFMYIKVVTIHCVYTHSYKYNVVKVKVTAFQVIRMQIIINFSKHMHIFFMKNWIIWKHERD